MENQEVESGLELVLDNRKLIITFGLLITICVCCFVLGFIEGKRQGYLEGSQTATESSAKQVPAAAQAQAVKTANEATKTTSPDTPDQQLDWYKNINRKGEEPVSAPAKQETNGAAKSPAPASTSVSTEKPKTPAKEEPVTYSVQVGAFRQKQELDLRAQMLREKGFECRVEPPVEPGQLFLLKVGRFGTRAEAAAVQLKLKKEGFSSFIKTN